jgi:hypothetical protein
MNRRTSISTLIIVLGLGLLLTYFLFIRFHILFIFLLCPLILGGSILSRIFRSWRDPRKPGGPGSRRGEQWGQGNRDSSYPQERKEFYQKDYKVYGEEEEEDTEDSST